MIKPDAMKNGHAGAILDKIIKSGFRIVALKQTQLTTEKAGEFYAIHKERPFYGELVQFMSSGVIIAAILEKNQPVVLFTSRFVEKLFKKLFPHYFFTDILPSPSPRYYRLKIEDKAWIYKNKLPELRLRS